MRGRREERVFYDVFNVRTFICAKILKESPLGVCCTSIDVTEVPLGAVAQAKRTTFNRNEHVIVHAFTSLSISTHQHQGPCGWSERTQRKAL